MEAQTVLLVMLVPLVLGTLTKATPATTSYKNFTYLGKYEGGSGKDGRAWTYFISDYKLSVSKALDECKLFFNGRLLTMFTREEDEYIRLRLQGLGIGASLEYVITGGKFNAAKSRWEWTETASPLIWSRWISSLPEASGRCIELIGELSNYGWVSILCDNPHLFICQF